MAFFTLWKWFAPWSKIQYHNMIFWYSEYVIKTPEQRKYEHQTKKRKTATILAQLDVLNAVCSSLEYH